MTLSTPGRPSATSPARPLPYGLVVNPRSALGRGKKVAVRVKRALAAAGVQSITLSGANADACAAAVTAAARTGLSGLILVGGDGLLGLVLQIAEARSLPIGIVPAGSGNDFARQFAMPKQPAAAVQRMLEAAAEPRAVDLGVVRFPDESRPGLIHERWFAGALSVGLDAAVNRRANAFKLPLGPLRYHFALVAEIALLPKRSFSVSTPREAGGDGVPGAGAGATGLGTPAGTGTDERSFSGLLTTAMNIRAIGGGIPLAPQAVPTDGLFDLVEVSYGSKRRLFSVLGVLAQGKHERLPEVTITRVRKATISAHSTRGAEIAYADGERVSTGPFDVRIEAGAMRLLG